MIGLSRRESLALPGLSLGRVLEVLQATVETPPVLSLERPADAELERLADLLADIVVSQVVAEMGSDAPK